MHYPQYLWWSIKEREYRISLNRNRTLNSNRPLNCNRTVNMPIRIVTAPWILTTPQNSSAFTHFHLRVWYAFIASEETVSATYLRMQHHTADKRVYRLWWASLCYSPLNMISQCRQNAFVASDERILCWSQTHLAMETNAFRTGNKHVENACLTFRHKDTPIVIVTTPSIATAPWIVTAAKLRWKNCNCGFYSRKYGMILWYKEKRFLT